MPVRAPSILLAASLLALLSACSVPESPPPPMSGVVSPKPAPVDTRPTLSDAPLSRTPDRSTAAVPLQAPKAVRSLEALRQQAAERLVAANPNGTYLGRVPDQLLAIPVLEVELYADGSVRRIVVLRYPTQARDTTQLAMDAVNRAAPFGDVSRMPKPWKFVETFLFNDDRHFKPRTLD